MKENSTGGLKVILMCLGAAVLLHVAFAFIALHSVIIAMLLPEPAPKSEPSIEKKREVTIAIMRPAPLVPKKRMPDPAAPAPNPEMAKKKPEVEKKEDLAKAEKVEPKKEKDVPKYTRTSDDQLQGEPDKAVLQGERSTIAASNAAPKLNAPDRAAVSGESSYKDKEELVDTSYQDGSLEHMNKGADGKPTAPTPPAPIAPPNEETLKKPELADLPDLPNLPDQPKPDTEKTAADKTAADKEAEEKLSSMTETPERGDALEKGELATTDKNVQKFLDTRNKILDKADDAIRELADEKKEGLAQENKTIENKDVNPDAMKQKAEEEKRKKQNQANKKASQPKEKATARKSDKGFRSEAKATVVEGSIFRTSRKGSANVKNTPLGKYMATVSKKVEQEWQRRCMMHADLIQPGSVRMSFVVMPNGKVKHTRTLMRMNGSEAQFNLTYQAINSVKLPPMPAAVRKIQEGDPIEFRYSFSF